MDDVNRTLNNIIIPVFQETKTKCFPVIIVQTQGAAQHTALTLSLLRHASLKNSQVQNISDWRTKHRNLPGRPNPPVIAIRYCFDSREQTTCNICLSVVISEHLETSVEDVPLP